MPYESIKEELLTNSLLCVGKKQIYTKKVNTNLYEYKNKHDRKPRVVKHMSLQLDFICHSIYGELNFL